MFSKLLKLKLVEKDMTATQLASLLGTTQQNLSYKIKKDNFTENDMRRICEILDCNLTLAITDI